MYTCGPSTYQRAHIGNYRTFLYEDVLQRYLEYLGYRVKRLITLTDVEDKAIEQAKKEGLTVPELTNKNEEAFFGDFKALRIKTPDYTVRASSAIDQATKLIAQLTKKQYAYWYTYKGEKNAYFDPLKFKGFGKLAHLDMAKWPKKKRRFHKDTYPGTPWNKGDFILWHGCPKSDACYGTAIGTGRPAWNIQDAAIVTKHMGFSIDFACGGIDNLVRHHDYTIAVAEAASGKQFSRFWLHGGHLFVEGKKMSKSLGNVLYTQDVLGRGFSGEQLRFFLIYAPYREKLNFTFKGLSEVSGKLASLKSMLSDMLTEKRGGKDAGNIDVPSQVEHDFTVNMNRNLDVKSAFDALYTTISELYSADVSFSGESKRNLVDSLRSIDCVLQCIF